MIGEYIPLIILLLVVLAILSGIPVAFALGGIPLWFGLFIFGEKFLGQFTMLTYGIMTDYSFTAVPLFILMGALLERSGMADNLYKSFYYLFGPLNGGLAIATVLMATLFGACTGIVAAGVVTIGLLAMPAMLSRGYSKEIAAGSICVGGGLGVIIPPSIMLILYGSVGGVSISDLFAGGIVPGLLFSLFYVVYIAVRCSLNPALGPALSREARSEISGRELFFMTIKSLIPPLALILVVLGSIFFGIVAPSEAAALGSVGAALIAAFAGKLTWKAVQESVLFTLKTTTMVMFIVLGGKFFMVLVLSTGAAELVENLILSLPLGTTGSLFIMMFIVFVLGCLVDWIGLLFIIVPILTPIIEKLGIDPLYFGILFCATLQIANMTPPLAFSAFFLKGICPPEVTIGDIYRGCVPFILLQMIVILILILFPKVVLYLPSIM
ncbi:MAG: TRAP transporter large permease subunit [Deltaproteobacteria bacterium]|nr:TRAP transporter large permease subunit [Deltaproteobacteria bacterium]